CIFQHFLDLLALLPTAPSSGSAKPGAEGSPVFPGAAGCCA
ncbi:hypothetical protein A2U01_0101235, partial [Trifolium medium]|nr:hypothetical protein [Trifolium medium]